jgi:hypothetical protein
MQHVSTWALLILTNILIEKSMLQTKTIGFITKLEFDVEKRFITCMFPSIHKYIT